MKKSGIIFISLIIVAVHVLVLFMALSPRTTEDLNPDDAKFMTTEEPAEPEKDLPGQPAPQTAEEPEVPAPPAAVNTAQPTTPAVVTPPAEVKTVPEKAPEPPASAPLQGKKIFQAKFPVLDRSKAVRNIPGIPVWKGTYPKMTGIMIDLNTHKVLWQKDSLKKVPIASLSKIMSLIVAYEAMLSGESRLHFDTQIPITRDARNVPPSGVAFKPEEKSFSLRKLMLAAAVKSANDATYLIAQAFGNGDADQFVKKMNQRAAELGMEKTTFHNPHGLPGRTKAEDNQSTATDVARMCEAYLSYPELREWASMRTATFRTKGDLVNHNHLLPGAKYACQGVSGIKTGFTNRAGFCVAAICTRNGRTLLVVVTGFGSGKERDTYVRSILNWGFKQK